MTTDYTQMTPEERQRLMAMILREQSMASSPSQSGVAQPQQASGSGGGMSPAMAMQFMPESGAGASTGGAEGAGMAGAAWPAALVADIVANETYQNKQGNRPEKFGDHMKALASGEVLEMDAKKYIGGPVGDFVGTMGNPKGIGTHIKKSLKPWEWFT